MPRYFLRVPGFSAQMGRTRKSALAAVGAAAVTAVALAAGSPAEQASAQGAPQEQPNVVVVMSDDQTQDSMRYMPRVQELIGQRGATFPTNVTNWPLCCPSRATFQTGQYAHNHDVRGNQPPLGGFARLDISQTLPVWLQDAGYYTAHVGKFLNGYESSPVGVPPGWSEWHGSKDTYKFYGYTLLENGSLNTYGSSNENADNPADPASYSTDVYTDKAVQVVNERAPSSDPFFLSVAYLAPHSGGPNNPPAEPAGRCEGSAKPAIRHAGAFGSEPLPLPPNYNEADIADKPAALANRDPLSANEVNRATRNYRCRIESLLAIDEGVAEIVSALRAAGELDDTLFVYTADNGFFHGEHRIVSGKNRVYEEAIRVPLLMRGPGIPEGVTVDDLSINADLPPTILDAAGATATVPQDGRSLLPYAEEPTRAHGRELLIEQYSPDGEDGEPTGTEYQAIRTTRYVYVLNATGETELYDLEADPFQLQNQSGNPAFAEPQAALASRLAALVSCQGKSCRSKPAIELKLPRQTRADGKPCTSPRDFVARVRNKAQGRLVRATFRVNGKEVGEDGKAVFKRRLPIRALRARNRAEIEVDAELVDGRVLTLHDRVRICN